MDYSTFPAAPRAEDSAARQVGARRWSVAATLAVMLLGGMGLFSSRQLSALRPAAAVHSASKLADFIDPFPETTVIRVNCTSKANPAGQEIFVAQKVDPGTCEAMSLSFEPVDGGKDDMVKGKLYTLAAVDPDWPKKDDPSTLDRKENSKSQRLLWLITNIPGVSQDYSLGEEIHEYEPPNKDGVLCDDGHEGEHRIALLLFEQMPPFEVIDYLTAPRQHFRVQDMLVKRVQQKPISDFFFYTKCGNYTMDEKMGVLPQV
jgi:hypothetical protein